MTATFDKVADIIAETSEIDRETITPDSHTIDDLGKRDEAASAPRLKRLRVSRGRG